MLVVVEDTWGVEGYGDDAAARVGSGEERSRA